jgi:hypothetical protein
VGYVGYDIDNDLYECDLSIMIDDIKQYFSTYGGNRGPFFSMFEVGFDNYRFDLIRVDPWRQYIRIFEFKSCRRDFVSDKKWQNYLKYCHTFTFVCPREVINKGDLPKGIGLLWIHKWRYKDRLKGCDDWLLDKEWVRKPRRKELDKDMLVKIAFMLAYRALWRPEDIF